MGRNEKHDGKIGKLFREKGIKCREIKNNEMQERRRKNKKNDLEMERKLKK